MRLDEWQKYIEAQFLDDEPEAPDPPANTIIETDSSHAVVIAREPLPQPAPAHIDATELVHRAPPDLEWDVNLLLNSLSVGSNDSDPNDSDPTESAADVCVSELQQPTSSMELPVSAERLMVESPILYGEVPDLDITLPAFDSYLPPSHRASRQGIVTRLSPSAPVTAISTPPCPMPESELPGVRPQLMIGSTDNDLPDSTAPTGEKGVSGPMRRAARTRARHARNVRPEHVPSGLSAGELWASVPKHVQTLLSLERLEEDQEVAQSSYKRPFQEKRRELIERLLDPILSLEDTARLLNVCPTTVRRYTNKGILTHYRKEPERSDRSDAMHGESGKETRQRRFRLSDILAFLETQQAALAVDDQVGTVGSRSAVSTRMRDRRLRSAQSSQYTTSLSTDIDGTQPIQPMKD